MKYMESIINDIRIHRLTICMINDDYFHVDLITKKTKDQGSR